MVAKSKADVDQATAGASGAAVGADQQTAGAVGGAYGESGNKQYADVAVEEAISTTSASQANYTQLAVNRLMSQYATIDNLQTQILQNAIENANALAKRMISQFDLADDRKWNVNETDAYSVQALKAVADILRNG